MQAQQRQLRTGPDTGIGRHLPMSWMKLPSGLDQARRPYFAALLIDQLNEGCINFQKQ